MRDDGDGIAPPDVPVFGAPREGLAYIARPAAYAVILDGDGEVAVMKNRWGYFLPGGGAEEEESPEETLSREVREESGREVIIQSEIGRALQFHVAGTRPIRSLATFFRARFGRETASPGELELLWCDPARAREILYHESHAWAIRHDREDRIRAV